MFKPGDADRLARWAPVSRGAWGCGEELATTGRRIPVPQQRRRRIPSLRGDTPEPTPVSTYAQQFIVLCRAAGCVCWSRRALVETKSRHA